MEALKRPGTGWVLPKALLTPSGLLSPCVVQQACLVPGSTVRPVGWTPSTFRYSVDTPVPGTLVLNEIAWPGWKMSVCDQQGAKCGELSAVDTTRFLVAVNVPSGAHQIRLRYETPRAGLAWILFWIGCVAAVLVAVSQGGRARLAAREWSRSRSKPTVGPPTADESPSRSQIAHGHGATVSGDQAQQVSNGRGGGE
jgi:hypothetical protein